MNLLEAELMKGPDVHSDEDHPCCVVCGASYPHVERHHVVFRSQGGGDGPTLDLCSAGGNGLMDGNGRITCHGAAHHRLLHFRVVDGEWWYLWTKEPTKYEKALEMDGWLPLRKVPYIRTVAGGDFGEIAY